MFITVKFQLHLQEEIREGTGNPLQYSCLENPMDREDCWATVVCWVANESERTEFDSTMTQEGLAGCSNTMGATTVGVDL